MAFRVSGFGFRVRVIQFMVQGASSFGVSIAVPRLKGGTARAHSAAGARPALVKG